MYKNEYHKLMKGIYKLTVGDKFYIGRANRLAERMYQHQGLINRCLSRYAMPKLSESHYIKFAKYLHENPLITTISAEIIQRGISSWDLHYAEHNWLTEIKGHPDCLNTQFFSTQANIDHDIWDAFIDDKYGIIFYFDPFDNDRRRYNMCTQLNKSGTIVKDKPNAKLSLDEFMYIAPVENGTDHTI